jgi:hypothetical protein
MMMTVHIEESVSTTPNETTQHSVVIDAAVLEEFRQAQRTTAERINKLQSSMENLFITPVQQGGSPYFAQNWTQRRLETNQFRELEANRILLVTIHELVYPITTEVLRQVFSLQGYVEKIEISPNNFHFQARIHFQLLQDAIRARDELQGRNIYDGCCRLDIQFSNLSDLSDVALDLSEIVQMAATTSVSQSEIEAPRVVVHELTPQSISIEASGDGYEAKIERNLQCEVAAAIVYEVTPSLINNEHPLKDILDACIQTENFELENLESDFDAHFLLDKMPIRKNLFVNVSVHENDNLGYLLPDFEVILAKEFSGNGIETKKSALLILMKTFFVSFDPGGNTSLVLEENMCGCFSCSSKERLIIYRFSSSSVHEFRRNIGLKMVSGIKHLMMHNGEVGVKKVLHFGSLNNVMMSVFGMYYKFSNGDSVAVEDLLSEGYELLGLFSMTDNFPVLSWFDFKGVKKRCIDFMVTTLIVSCADLKWRMWVRFFKYANRFVKLLSLSNFQETLDLLCCYNGISTFIGKMESTNYKHVIRQHLDVQILQERLEDGLHSDGTLKFTRELLFIIDSNSSEYVISTESRQPITKQRTRLNSATNSSKYENVTSAAKLEENEEVPPRNLPFPSKKTHSDSLFLSAKKISTNPNASSDGRSYDKKIEFVRFVFDPGGVTK